MTSTVIAYHAVGDCPRADDPHNLWVPVATFEKHMAYLAGHRRVVPLADLVAGRPGVAITFDDAYRCVLTDALPILKAYGLPATVFTPTAYLGDRNRWDPPASPDWPLDIMSEDELRHVDGAGITVESHGHHHADLSQADEDVARSDLEPSVDCLASVLGRRPDFVAFPFRTGSPAARRAAAALGFTAAFTIDLPHDGRYGWGRVGISPTDSMALFGLKTSGQYLRLRHQPVLDRAYRFLRRR